MSQNDKQLKHTKTDPCYQPYCMLLFILLPYLLTYLIIYFDAGNELVFFTIMCGKVYYYS